jgi:UDP-N-acetylglucosamine--N-acetylmuramyl-(pentapeptide) pyrophosphoryl-undecaprenol N-acetylglucosamine transferase
VYPILAVLQYLDDQDESSQEICYVGNASSIEAKLTAQAGLPFREITTASFHGASPWAIPSRLAQLSRGTAQCVGIVDKFLPQAVLATGGYVCAPPVLAAWIRKVPSVIYLPDVAPGLAVRTLGRCATVVAVSNQRSTGFFAPGKAVVTGYPVRKELFQIDKTASRVKLGLEQGEKTLLVLGGSQGAHSINLAVGAILEDLLAVCQIVHISGEADASWLRSRRDELPSAQADRYAVHPYMHEEIIDALAAADLALARAGAATTGEFPAVGLPSILVPYPHVGRHQELNADHMVEHNAAVKLSDADLEKGVLRDTILGLLTDDGRLEGLAEGAHRLAQPSAAQRIADLLREIARPSRSTQRGSS